jgi:hypothetical protein
MRELPSRIANHLLHSARHAVQEITKAEFATNQFCQLQVALSRRPAASHEQVKANSCREDMIIVELG